MDITSYLENHVCQGGDTPLGLNGTYLSLSLPCRSVFFTHLSEVTVVLVHTSIQSNNKTAMEKALEIKYHRNNEPGLG